MPQYSDIQDVVVEEVIPAAKGQWSRNAVTKKNLNGLITKTWMPDGADAEYKDFMRKARSPWLQYAARVLSQGLIVDGYSDTGVWEKVWQASGMDGRQSALNEQVTGYGYGLLLTFPADDGGVFMRPLSVLSTHAWSEDPWSDSPDVVVHKVTEKLWRIFTDEAMFEVHGTPDRPDDNPIVTPHRAGVNPVTLIPSQFAMDGLPSSLAMEGFPAYKRIVDATFMLQMLQRYAGFPQKWQSGGEVEEDENGNSLVRPSVDSLMHSDDPTSRFGNFAPADMNQMIAAIDKHVQDLAVATQIPPHYLLGKVVNLSSDALAATETAYSRLIGTMREAAGEGYEQALRIGAAHLGMSDAASDLSTEIHWRDTGVVALGSASDAVVKFDSVGVPPKYLLRFVPGMSKNEIEDAVKEMRTAAPDASSPAAAAGPDVTTQVKSMADALGALIRSGVDPANAAEMVGLAGAEFTGAVPVSLRMPEDQAAALEE